MRRIVIRSGSLEAKATLNDSPTARSIAGALPIEARANTWGDEVYFGIPVKADLEPDSREVMQAGELAYWPAGQAFCIFFGPTPASRGSEIRAAGAVNVVGRLQTDPAAFKAVSAGAAVRIEANHRE